MPRTRRAGCGSPASTPCRTSAPSALADPAGREAGGPRWWLVGLSLFLALAVGVVTWLSGQQSTDRAPVDGTHGTEGDRTQAIALLAELESAVRRRDLSAGAHLGDAPGVRAHLAGVV